MSNNNWTNIRGKKMKINEEKKNINFELVEKKILAITKLELDRINHENILFPNIYSSWIVK
jgi:hypothetical protein